VTPLLAALAVLLGAWLVVGLAFRRELAAAWREPVLRAPVLIIESDDWGPGPDADAVRLAELAALFERHRDARGRPAVMTLGLLLSVPDTRAIAEERLSAYRERRLDDPEFARIVQALRDGRDRGVFALQLHGMAHYWPPALFAAASTDPTVRGWLGEQGVPRHERLPPALQCRWVDGSRLPSRPLPAEDVAEAAATEVAAFAGILGEPARVAVPPAFVWDARVEAGWAASGIEAVVTPGRRFTGIAADASLVADSPTIWNGEQPATGVTYVVRDVYFEPARGHRAERALAALAEKTLAGRPTLLETHRVNFTGAEQQAADAVKEVARLLTDATRTFPALRFLSTRELAEALRRRDPELVDRRPRARVHAWLRRVAALPRARRSAWATGLIGPAAVLFALTREARPGVPPPSARG
jgi:hypothetical protein